MIEDHQSHCIQYLKITMKTSLIDAIAVRKSRRFLDVFIYTNGCHIYDTDSNRRFIWIGRRYDGFIDGYLRVDF